MQTQYGVDFSHWNTLSGHARLGRFGRAGSVSKRLKNNALGRVSGRFHKVFWNSPKSDHLFPEWVIKLFQNR